MAPQIARDFAAAGRMADHDGAFEIERLHQLREIVGISREVVAIPGLAGAAVAAPVMGDTAEAARREKPQLVVPGIGIERPAMREHHRLARAPILVIDLRAILCRDAAHRACSCRCASDAAHVRFAGGGFGGRSRESGRENSSDQHTASGYDPSSIALNF